MPASSVLPYVLQLDVLNPLAFFLFPKNILDTYAAKKHVAGCYTVALFIVGPLNIISRQ
jgi:hypothetical protein